MGDKSPKDKMKHKKHHQAEMAKKQAERQSHTHKFNGDGGGAPNNNTNNWQGNNNQNKKAS